MDNITDYKAIIASREGLDWDIVGDVSNKHPLLDQTEYSNIPDDIHWVLEFPASLRDLQELTHPLNESEKYRIKRALLRFELFCALFHLGPDEFFDALARIPHARIFYRDEYRAEQEMFFKEYVNHWEIAEVGVIMQFMFDVVRHAFFHKYNSLRYDEAYRSWYCPGHPRVHGENRHRDHDEVVYEFDNLLIWHTSQGLGMLRGIYDDREKGYDALIKKYGQLRYRSPSLFQPYYEILRLSRYSDRTIAWRPRHEWQDTPGLELPSKGWLPFGARGGEPAWGYKWLRKIGLYIWDRE